MPTAASLRRRRRCGAHPPRPAAVRASSSYGRSDHPVALAELADALEAVALEQLQGAVVQERRGDLAAVDQLGVALDRAAAEPRDLRPAHRRARPRRRPACGAPCRRRST